MDMAALLLNHLPTTLCDGVHVQKVAYQHRDSVLKVLKDDEKEHEEDDDKHKDIEKKTRQTKASGGLLKMAEEDALLAFSMSVVYALTTLMPEDCGDDATVEQIRKRSKWDNNDYVCRGLILKGMSYPLFDIYQNIESRKEL
ncbi:hypothetical protein Tco_0965017 [Tanacetum coccineum]